MADEASSLEGVSSAEPVSGEDLAGLSEDTTEAPELPGYFSFYGHFFETIRPQPIRLLQIGVSPRTSLYAWREYFPNALVVCADPHPGIRTQEDSGIVTEVVDPSNIEDLVGLGLTYGPFDILIECGARPWEHQITTFKTLFPFLKNDGTYIVEDLQTNFGTLADEFRGSSRISFVDYLKKLVDLRVADDAIDIAAEQDPFLRTYGQNIQSVTFYQGGCVVRKDYRENPRRVLPPGPEAGDIEDTPFADLPPADEMTGLALVCHISDVGDRMSTSGALKVLPAHANIQGFILYCADALGTKLEYRARMADGEWTGWVKSGQFAGTMGQGQNLSGFAVRIADPRDEIHDLDVVGLFRAEEDPVIVGNGEDCIPEFDVTGDLYGMQIIVRTNA
jgi:hypothetical protein